MRASIAAANDVVGTEGTDTCGAGSNSHPALMHSGIFDFRPAMIIRALGLTKPRGWSYRQSANYGHFGRSVFPWEKTNRVEALRDAAGLK